MTEPLPTNDPAASLIGLGAQALIDNAKRLGLTWQLRLATVVDAVSGNQLLVRFDGDETSVTAVSMIGLVPANSRVYVISVPPSGNFAVGWVSYEHQVFHGETGTVFISFAGVASFTQAITFDVPFAAIPVVFTNIDSSSGNVTAWWSYAYGVTTTGFTLWVRSSTVSTWNNVAVQWAAFASI
jgi:hypothetical protein